jgi:pimeloyl-ACP methyl ester carboxylesterase
MFRAHTAAQAAGSWNSGIVETSAGPLHYAEIGSGPSLVFVHGALVDGEIWRATAEHLQRSHRCILPTLPLGSHQTPLHRDADLSPLGVARLLGEFCDLLALDHPTLVANDSGGAVSQLLAVAEPQRLGALVLTNCDALEVFPPRAYRHLKFLARVPGAVYEMALAMRMFPALGRLPGAFGPLSVKRISAATIRRWVTPASKLSRVRADLAKFFRGAAPEVTLEAAQSFPELEIPVLLAWGAADPYFTADLAQRLAASFRHAELRWIDGGRTYVMLDEPEELAEVIDDFLARAEAPVKTPVPVRRAG